MGLAVEAIVPANIAWIKYWGKRGPQWPVNDSLSMTLRNAVTQTLVAAAPGSEDRFEWSHRVETLDEGADRAAQQRALEHIARLRTLVPSMWRREPVVVRSMNSFPPACGIASSASGYGALTLALVAYWTQSTCWEELEERGFGRARLADWARLGSGSACRSLWGGFVEWRAGGHPAEQEMRQVHTEAHWRLFDLIVVPSPGQVKGVSSREGHQGAFTSPLFYPRQLRLGERMKRVRRALEQRSLSDLREDLEAEALELHAVAMTSQPSAQYWTSGTSEVWQALGVMRLEEGMPFVLTMDAGSSVHVLGEAADRGRILEALRRHRGERAWEIVEDEVGPGPHLRRL